MTIDQQSGWRRWTKAQISLGSKLSQRLSQKQRLNPSLD